MLSLGIINPLLSIDNHARLLLHKLSSLDFQKKDGIEFASFLVKDSKVAVLLWTGCENLTKELLNSCVALQKAVMGVEAFDSDEKLKLIHDISEIFLMLPKISAYVPNSAQFSTQESFKSRIQEEKTKIVKLKNDLANLQKQARKSNITEKRALESSFERENIDKMMPILKDNSIILLDMIGQFKNDVLNRGIRLPTSVLQYIESRRKRDERAVEKLENMIKKLENLCKKQWEYELTRVVAEQEEIDLMKQAMSDFQDRNIKALQRSQGLEKLLNQIGNCRVQVDQQNLSAACVPGEYEQELSGLLDILLAPDCMENQKRRLRSIEFWADLREWTKCLDSSDNEEEMDGFKLFKRELSTFECLGEQLIDEEIIDEFKVPKPIKKVQKTRRLKTFVKDGSSSYDYLNEQRRKAWEEMIKAPNDVECVDSMLDIAQNSEFLKIPLKEISSVDNYWTIKIVEPKQVQTNYQKIDRIELDDQVLEDYQHYCAMLG